MKTFKGILERHLAEYEGAGSYLLLLLLGIPLPVPAMIPVCRHQR